MRRISSFVSPDSDVSAILMGMTVAMLVIAFSAHSLRAESLSVTESCDVSVLAEAKVYTEHLENDHTLASSDEAPALVIADTSGDESEILWFARVIYSETKRPDEQELVAWVVRNRVDTAYRGNATYKDTALDPHQFSGLNPGDNLYEYNISRTRDYDAPAWKNALRIAEEVYYASESERPFSKMVRHFYSPVAVKSHPAWAVGVEAALVVTDPGTNAKRFAFYSNVQ